MIRIILTAAALTLAGPALAASQLEALLGVSPSVYSPAQLARLHFAHGDDDATRPFFDTTGAFVFSSHGQKSEFPTSARTPSMTVSAPTGR